MSVEQFCARWGCDKRVTYDKPLCYTHWQQWEAWELEECNRCHYYYDNGEMISQGENFENTAENYPQMCDACLDVTLLDEGKGRIWKGEELERRPIIAHADIERPVRYVYILKLSDGTFYVGQTIDLKIRFQEHKDGLQTQTKGKGPRFVYFDSFNGKRDLVDEREMELTILNSSEHGRRKIRQLIESFRIPLKLLDLDI